MEDKKAFILKILSLIDGYELSPIQLQKFFFLLEKRIGDEANLFNFEPYYYGPYSQELKDMVSELEKNGYIQSNNINGIQHCSIARPVSKQELESFLSEEKKSFISTKLIDFVTKKKFRDLCFSIYKEFPEMAKRSVLLKK